uniref:Uncharacterized protein n=1 Tax=Desulfatirhabdium butyrativorans TaxID=340467 RepID=A0A7C4W0N0_9BACT
MKFAILAKIYLTEAGSKDSKGSRDALQRSLTKENIQRDEGWSAQEMSWKKRSGVFLIPNESQPLSSDS